MKMQRSSSFIDLSNNKMERSHSRRGIYINQQTSKRQVGTIFHSPFKDGKKNKDYINPSFISSHLFYGEQVILNPPKNIVVQKNMIPNVNDRKKQILYQQRIRKERSYADLTKSREKNAQNKARELNKQKKSKQFRLNDPEQRLRSQLDGLKNYRENLALKQQKNVILSRHIPKADDFPAYFEKNRVDYNYERKQIQKQKSELSEWLAIQNELKQMKNEMRKDLRSQEIKSVEKTAHRHIVHKQNQQYDNRRNAFLLANILKEQIRTSQIKKSRKQYA